MKLYGTPPSHFTRKVRVILQELSISHEFLALDRLLETGEEKFAQNPLHQFPVLEDQGRRLIESDLICEYLLKTYGARNPELALLPSGDSMGHKQRLAMMNGGMAAGVKLIRAKRSGLSWDCPFFRQEEAALTGSLHWLDQDLGAKTAYEPGKLTLLDISLLCFAEWAVFRELTPLVPKNIARFVETNRDRPSFAQTHPSREVL
jgi:glutathione S-transferase